MTIKLLYSPIDIFEPTVIFFLDCRSSLNFFTYLPTLTNTVIYLFFILAGISLVVKYFVNRERGKIKYLVVAKALAPIKTIQLIQTATFRNLFGQNYQQPHIILFNVIYICLIILNLCGLLPYGLPITSYLSVTLFCSSLFFLSFTIIGLTIHRTAFIGLWIPQGTPYIIIPFIVIIEIISYNMRLFSLAVRLFANIMAGHTLIKILSGFSYTLIMMGGVLTYIGIMPLIAIFLIIVLETIVAVLQAYVFMTLLTIYFKDIILLH